MWLPWPQPRSQGVSSFHFLEGGRKRDPGNEVFLNRHKFKMAGDCCVYKFPRRSVGWKIFAALSEWNLPFSNSFSVVWTRPKYPPLGNARWRMFHQLYSRVRIEFWRTGLKANQEGQLNEKSRKTDFISCDFLTTHVKRLSKTRIGENPMLQCSWHWIYSVGTCKPYLCAANLTLLNRTQLRKELWSAPKAFPIFLILQGWMLISAAFLGSWTTYVSTHLYTLEYQRQIGVPKALPIFLILQDWMTISAASLGSWTTYGSTHLYTL